MRHEALPRPGGDDIEEAPSRGDLAGLRLIPLPVSLHPGDPERAELVCRRLAGHGGGITRGNPVLGLGHIARIHRTLTGGVARPVVEAALRDPDEWVGGRAASAAGDLEHFLGWKLDRP